MGCKWPLDIFERAEICTDPPCLVTPSVVLLDLQCVHFLKISLCTTRASQET